MDLSKQNLSHYCASAVVLNNFQTTKTNSEKEKTARLYQEKHLDMPRHIFTPMFIKVHTLTKGVIVSISSSILGAVLCLRNAVMVEEINWANFVGKGGVQLQHQHHLSFQTNKCYVCPISMVVMEIIVVVV